MSSGRVQGWWKLTSALFPEFVNVLADNARLATADEQFMKADISYTTVKSNGYGENSSGSNSNVKLTLALRSDLNVLEMRPPLMDLSGRTKYPILVSV